MKSAAPPLLALLLLVASAAGAEQVRCVDDHARCREGCTLEFGTTYRTRQKLGLCIEACVRDYQSCEASFAKALKAPPERRQEAKPQPRAPREPPATARREPPPRPAGPRKEAPARAPAPATTASAASETSSSRTEPDRPRAAAVEPVHPAQKAVVKKPRSARKPRDLFDWHPGDPG